jgi:hypothetical protein
MSDPLGQVHGRAGATQVRLVRVQGVDEAIDHAKSAKDSENRLEGHGGVAMLKAT